MSPLGLSRFQFHQIAALFILIVGAVSDNQNITLLGIGVAIVNLGDKS
jgi:hypothetical protein